MFSGSRTQTEIGRQMKAPSRVADRGVASEDAVDGRLSIGIVFRIVEASLAVATLAAVHSLYSRIRASCYSEI